MRDSINIRTATHDSTNVDSPRPSNPPNTSVYHSEADRPKVSVERIDVERMRTRLRLWTEDAAVAMRERADRYTATAARAFAQLGRELNKMTGYEEIETLKQEVVAQEARIKATRVAARNAKFAHEQAVQQRAQSQREVNDLLQRKSTWTDEDVGRFTALVRQDPLFEQAESRAKATATSTEDEVERAFTELMRVILNRYHEEQVWSDKVRSASTYGSLTVLGLNLLVFVLAIVLVEPWKRRRLAQTFERKVEEMSSSTMMAFGDKTQSLSQQLKEQEREISRLMDLVIQSLRPGAAVEDSVKVEVVKDTVLDRKLSAQRLASHSRESLWLMAGAAGAAGVLGWIVGCYFEC